MGVAEALADGEDVLDALAAETVKVTCFPAFSSESCEAVAGLNATVFPL
jgi:hypothetical protein